MAASPQSIAVPDVPPRRLVILMLTRRSVPNAALWKQWARGRPISFVLNAKYVGSSEGGDRGGMDPRVAAKFGGLPQDQRVTNTAWGSHTVCLAHQAMLRAGLDHHPDAAWFMLVSGDSVPLTSARKLMAELEALGPHHSMMGKFEDGHRMINFVRHFRELRGDALVGNWWVKNLDNGSITADMVWCHTQFVLLSRHHAQLLKDMPKKVLEDFDALMGIDSAKGRTRAQKNFLSADEVVPWTYLHWKGCGDHLLPLDPMLAPEVGIHAQDFKGRVPVSIMEKVDEVDGVPAFFLRKVTLPLQPRERKRLRAVWRSRPPVFIPDKVPSSAAPQASHVMTRARKRQRVAAPNHHFPCCAT